VALDIFVIFVVERFRFIGEVGGGEKAEAEEEHGGGGGDVGIIKLVVVDVDNAVVSSRNGSRECFWSQIGEET